MNQTMPRTPLRDIFYAFSLAKEMPDAELLDEYVRLYPNHATALTDFAIEMIIDVANGQSEGTSEFGELKVSATVSRVMSRFQNRLFDSRGSEATRAGQGSRSLLPVSNPFAMLDREAFRELTRSLQANPVFVAKLRDREIDSSTMSDGFRRRIADETKVPLDLVVAHFTARAEVSAGQFYKAGAKPAAPPKQSFQEAVKTSGLTDEQQRYLLSL
ncbi:MAG: hypothetical protein ABSA39_22475 [Edaphobacter sp.]|jgi:hypothetical protein